MAARQMKEIQRKLSTLNYPRANAPAQSLLFAGMERYALLEWLFFRLLGDKSPFSQQSLQGDAMDRDEETARIQYLAEIAKFLGITNTIDTEAIQVYQYLISGNCSSSPTLDVLEDLPIPLCSVYASTRGEPPFTNYTPGFTGTLDYIFFSPSDHIQPVSLLELPGPESSDISGGLPNFNYPSDHLPIGAEFVISQE